MPTSPYWNAPSAVKRMRTSLSAGRMLALVVLLSCFGGDDHEARGDRAYADGEFAVALTEYRLALRQAAPDAGLRAKAAMAALHTGDLQAAAEEYRAMAEETDDRVAEAADGLERVARTALNDGDRAALEAALAGFQAVAEGRAIGSFARELAGGLGEAPRSQDALQVLLYAAAAAPDAGQQDSLMFVYGSVLRRLGRCEAAADVFESLARRQRQPTLVGQAQIAGASCALRVGQNEVSRGAPQAAEEWFQRAARIGGDNIYGREGYLRLGDVRLTLGQYESALAAYERAALGLQPSDSLYQVVADRINALGAAGTRFR